MVTDRTLHSRQDVIALIGLQQQENSACLAFAAALLFEQSFQKSAGDVAQFSEATTQNCELLAMVTGWPVGRVDSLLPSLADE